MSAFPSLSSSSSASATGRTGDQSQTGYRVTFGDIGAPSWLNDSPIKAAAANPMVWAGVALAALLLWQFSRGSTRK